MPIVFIHLLAGRPPAKKRELIRQVSDAVINTLDLKPEHVRVVLNEVPEENWGVAGLPIAEYRQAQKG